MTPEQIELVQTSFEKVVPIQDTAAEIFYANLFEADPRLRHLFTTDMAEQGRKLMLTLRTAVHGLNDLDSLVPIVRDLGVRHAGYGVKIEHYDTVGAALLRTLEQGLGEHFTAEVKHAWAAAFKLLSSVMIDAGHEQAA